MSKKVLIYESDLQTNQSWVLPVNVDMYYLVLCPGCRVHYEAGVMGMVILWVNRGSVGSSYGSRCCPKKVLSQAAA